MKYFFCLFIFFINFNIFSKEKIVIFEFNTIDISSNIKELSYQTLTTSLIEGNKYEVLERDQLNKIINELKLVSNDEFTNKQVIEIGELIKANTAIIGSLIKNKNNYTINIRGINIETGGSLFAKNLTLQSEQDLLEAIKDIGYFISGKNFKSKLYTKKIVPPVILTITGSILLTGGITGLSLSIYYFIEEEKKYVKDPLYSPNQYLNLRNGQIAGIILSSFSILFGSGLLIASIPLYVNAINYKKEFVFYTESSFDNIKIGLLINL